MISATRSAPICAGSTTSLAPAYSSLVTVDGDSPRAMIIIDLFRLRAVRVMNTFTASSGSTVARARAIDASLLQHRLVGGISVHAQIAKCAHLLEPLRAAFKDDELRPAGLQLAGQHAADAAEAADDDMVAQVLD